MPLNGNTFTRLYSWVADAANGIKIRADRMDADTDDIGGGITAVATAINTLLLNLANYSYTLELLTVKSGGGSGTDYTDVSFLSSRFITTHAWYDFLANGTFQPAGGAPIYGHASFNSNLKITGAVAIDHHNDYQAYPQFNTSTTTQATAGFFYQPQVDGGTILEMDGLHVFDALGSVGTINNQYGVKVESLVRGAGNYAIFTAGTTPSQFGGMLLLGTPGSSASFGYDPGSGNVILIPRSTFAVHVQSEYLYLGSSSTGTAQTIRSNAGTGDLEITPRSGFKARILGALEVVGPVMVGSYTVATLPAAATYPRGHAFVSDANSTTFNAAVVGGGANKMPVISDGAAWHIG